MRIFLGIFILSTLIVSCTPKDRKANSSAAISANEPHQDPDGYWTCLMHPQVHMHEAGKCPICGMALVKVFAKSKIEKVEGTEVDVSNTQLKNTQISKYTVVRKDFVKALPVSGRLLSAREVAFQIYESDLPSVKNGLKFTGSASSNPSKVISGRIMRIDNLVDPTSRTVRVTGILDEKVRSQIDEGGFSGEILNRIKNQIVVPEDSVLHAGSRDLVYIFSSDNKLEPREVKLGQKGDKEYQIISGLKDGDVISSGANFLIDSEAKLRGQ